MKISKFKGLMLGIALLGSIGSINSEYSDGLQHVLDDVFLKQNLTEKDSTIIFNNARESYATLKALQMQDTTSQLQSLTKLKVFLSRIMWDITRENISLFLVFDRINEYLKDDSSVTQEVQVNEETLAKMVEDVILAAEERLGSYYEMAGRRRQDIHHILSHNTTLQYFFRNNSEIDASSIGYFFLEVFATLIGLSWGIISMIMAELNG